LIESQDVLFRVGDFKGDSGREIFEFVTFMDLNRFGLDVFVEFVARVELEDFDIQVVSKGVAGGNGFDITITHVFNLELVEIVINSRCKTSSKSEIFVVSASGSSIKLFNSIHGDFKSHIARIFSEFSFNRVENNTEELFFGIMVHNQ